MAALRQFVLYNDTSLLTDDMQDLISISQYQDLVGGLTFEQCNEEDVFYRNFKIRMAALANEKAELEESKSSKIIK